MIFGTYPCCDGALAIPVPDRTPMYLPETCPHCGAKVWHRLSRIDPESWTEAEFLAEYVIDEETKTIRDRTPPPELPPEWKGVLRRFAEEMEREILYGEPSGPVVGLINQALNSK